MKNFIITLVILLLCLSLSLMVNCGGGGTDISSPVRQGTPTSNPLSLPSSDAQLDEHMEGEVIIRYEKGYDPSVIAGTGKVMDTMSFADKYYARIKLLQGSSIVETIKTLRNTKGVICAQPDYIIGDVENSDIQKTGRSDYISSSSSSTFEPDDPYYNTRQYGPQLCNAPKGWAKTQGDPNVVIAIVDCGVNGNHEDLKDNMIDGYDFTGEINPDPNGGPISGNSNSDNVGHGTHVAGIAAARGNNGTGIAGIAWNCKIMPVKVLNIGRTGPVWRIARGIQFAVNPSDPSFGLSNPPPGANIINLSISGDVGFSDFITSDVIAYALDNNVVVVSGSGNDGMQIYQSSAHLSGVIATGSIDGTNSRAYDSNKEYYISMAAPGVKIYSTYNSSDNSYKVDSGTSMATPFISGVCALIISSHPELNIHYDPSLTFVPEKVKSHLENTATDIGAPGRDIEMGYGKPDIGKAVTLSTINNKYGRIEVNTNLTADPNTTSKLTGWVVLYDSQNIMSHTQWIGDSPNASFYNLKTDTYKVIVTSIRTMNSIEQTDIVVTPGVTVPVTITF